MIFWAKRVIFWANTVIFYANAVVFFSKYSCILGKGCVLGNYSVFGLIQWYSGEIQL